MSASILTVRYDGQILSGHQMDVADLAPALLGLSELCKIANKKFNGDRAAVKVLIHTDIEHKCFQFKLTIAQSIWESTKALLANDDVKSAEDLLTWLGFLIPPTGVSVYGFIRLLKWLRGRKIDSTKMIVEAGENVTQINVGGDFILVHPQAYELLRDKTALSSVKKVFEPVSKDGYDFVEFEDAATHSEKVDKKAAVAIAATAVEATEGEESDEPQLITAWVKVYSPVYDPKATHWRFTYGESHPYMEFLKPILRNVPLSVVMPRWTMPIR